MLVKLFIPLFFILAALFSTPVYAIVDPLAVPNNKFGIHIIQATPEESSPAASLVNSSGGDWGYITVLVESKDRNHDKWQQFFDDLRRRHLIPLVRLATQPEGNYWKRPYEKEEEAWADFLDALNWPVKNRYIIIYNEPNHATEWGNKVDAKSYAKTLDQTITALKNKNRDFFVLNAGFDASAPSQPPNYEDEADFMVQMNEAIPGIFDKLDGWVSHSYPNPEFVGSPDDIGRGTVRTYIWEIQKLHSLGINKDLPIFITETGWKHAEGLAYQARLPDIDTVSQYYQQAFNNVWSSNKIAAVTPFLLNYQEAPFDHFSFKKPTGEKQQEKILGVESTEVNSQYYPIYQAIQKLPKIVGKPVQEIKAQLVQGEIYSSIVSGENYSILLTFKNTGQSIWNDRDLVRLIPVAGGQNLGIDSVGIPQSTTIEPGQSYTFKVKLKAPQSGNYQVSLNLFAGNKQFDTPPLKFSTQVKSPVILKVMAALGWKKDFAGDYTLKITGPNGKSSQNITLNAGGVSGEIETRYLLPDYTFEFSLEKPFYIPKTLNQKVYAGVNTLNFGTMQPDLLSAIVHPIKFWQFFSSSK